MKKLLIIWSLILVIASLFLARTNYVSASNDSRFYSEQVDLYYNKSWQEILAPKWGNNYGFDPNSYMRDQFPGQMLMGVGLSRLGVTPKHALHIIEMFFQVLSIFIFYELAILFIRPDQATVLFYGLLLVPNAFSYNLRANHESGITFFSALSLLIGLKIKRNQWRWIFLSMLAAVSLLLIKGPFAIFYFGLFCIGFLYNEKQKDTLVFALWALVLAAVMVFLTLIGFEKLFVHVTGLSFLDEFYRLQFKARAIDLKSEHTFLIQKILNFKYYFLKCLAYAAPWTLIGFFILIKQKFNVKKMHFINSNLSYSLILSSLLFCGIFSMSDRIAGRYCYPAYYFFAAWMILFCYFNIKVFSDFHQKIINKNLIYFVIPLWCLAFIIHFI